MAATATGTAITKRGQAALALITMIPEKRHQLSSYTGSLFYVAAHLELTQEAIVQKKLDEASGWINAGFPRSEKDASLVMAFLIRACGLLWDSYRHDIYGAELLSWLVNMCARLRLHFQCMDLWKAYCLALMAVTAGVHGISGAEEFLGNLKEHMTLEDTLPLLGESSCLRLNDLVDCKAYVHCGVAFQALLCINDTPLKLLDAVDASRGFLTSKMWCYREQWVSLISQVFRRGNVSDLKSGDHSGTVIELVTVCLNILGEMKKQQQVDSPAYSTADVLWVHVLRSLSFVGLVKALKYFILIRNCSKEWLVEFLGVVLSSIWHGQNPVGSDDQAAYKELKDLLHGLFDSDKIHVDPSDVEGSFRQQLKLVSAAVRFYMFVIFTIARGEAKHNNELLSDDELYIGERWLRCLDQQVRDAKPTDPFLDRRCSEALSVVNLGLVLNADPLAYEYGLPLD